jgi:hypothetical protein
MYVLRIYEISTNETLEHCCMYVCMYVLMHLCTVCINVYLYM